ncbi:PREDICTED: FERM domain-containing protein 8-like isoform X2 [Priapulus caudatus]|uniref:FERM domain-containing protein 8 n=1 Tax=Priapulus caudatus TaxID=37621 RepID=A0ABM1EC67_PRICU|nr:PREDICTED: FERM domain-containing protein 8-like isoform X2 [Priapulus caudatus]
MDEEAMDNVIPMDTYILPNTKNTLVIPVQYRAAEGRGSGEVSGPHLVIPSPGGSAYSRNLTKSIEICVFLADKSGVEFSVDGGKMATAQDLHELVVELLELTSIARDLFALWVTSPLLEIQLRPHHIPFRVVQQWPDLVQKYTSATAEEIIQDEPVLMFRRNVFFSKAREMREATDAESLRLLYEEAKFNVVESRCPCSSADCEKLAGLQAVIEHGQYDHNQHKPAFYKNKVRSYLPEYMCKSSWLKTKAETRISHQHMRMSTKDPQDALYTKYLTHVWNMPFYGSAFFKGQIERPAGILGTWTQNPDVEVFVAINSECVNIIDREKHELTLSVPFEKLSWEYMQPPCQGQEGRMPCLFLQFMCCEDRSMVTNLLQVFSKQAAMMDAMIESCVLMKTGSVPNTPSSCTAPVYPPLHVHNENGNTDADAGYACTQQMGEHGVAAAIPSLVAHLERLVVSTFNLQGECMKDGSRRQAWRFDR